jgi:hypothetical protein
MSRFHRRLLLAVILVVTAGSLPATGTAYAKDSHKSLEQTYTDLRVAVVKRFGVRTAGRNIRRQGLRTPKGKVIEAQPRHLARSIRTYRRWLAPPAPVASATDNKPVTYHTSQPAYAGGKWSIPSSIVMCESGGDYGAVNSSSGARGAYQLLPSTYYSHGGDGSWSPADQDRVAARVWNGGAGRGQWVC